MTINRFRVSVQALFIIGQDVSVFLSLEGNGMLAFTDSFLATNPKVLSFFFIPPAWTVGIEIMFYLIVPFLVRLNTLLLGIICLFSIGGRLYFYSLGYDYDPWTYRFFPFELVYFILGMIAYRAYHRINFEKISPVLIKSFYYGILLFTLGYQFIPLSFKGELYIILITLVLPFIFQFSKHDKLDRLIGEYSYPIYIVHLLVLSLLLMLMNALKIPLGFFSELAIPICFIASWFLIHWIANPIEQIRFKLVNKSQPIKPANIKEEIVLNTK